MTRDRLTERIRSAVDGWTTPTSPLLRNPQGTYDGHPVAAGTHELVPASVWWAQDLLTRDDEASHERARSVLRWLAEAQYDAPGSPWDGSFPVFGETPAPGRRAVEWRDYDPNWRQFVGVAVALVLADHPDAVGADLQAVLRRTVDRAVRCEPRGRVDAEYTNIAILWAWLLAHHGVCTDDETLVEQGEALAHAVVARLESTAGADEFASPTYLGISLQGLGLWVGLPATAALVELGRRGARTVWAEVCDLWHPTLGNLVGPYARAYFPDLTRAVGGTGLWVLAAAPDCDRPPLPPLDADVLPHGHDLPLWFHVVRLIDDLDLDAPPRRVVTSLTRRERARGLVVTQWRTTDLAVGALAAPVALPHDAMPVVAHWRTDASRDAPIGTWHVRANAPIDAAVEEGAVLIRPRGSLRIEVGPDVEVDGDVLRTPAWSWRRRELRDGTIVMAASRER